MRLIAMLVAVLVLGSPARAQPDPAATGGDGPLTARFMGVSTILLSDGQTHILVDGFFSRPSLPRVIATRLTPDDERIRRALDRAEIGKLHGVLVAHAHHDHAMDSAVIAHLRETVLIGSESVANIGLGHRPPVSRIIRIVDDARLTCGQFSIRVIATPHNHHLALWAITGRIAAPLTTPARATAYKDILNFSFLVTHRGRRILIHPSAHHAYGIMDERDIKADLIFLGIGNLGSRSRAFTDRYWREVVRATEARTIVPIHWDDFFRSLDQPLEPLPGFDRAMTSLTAHAIRDRVELRLPAPFVPFDLGPPRAPPGPISSPTCAEADSQAG
jgi:L-ascorbate metabolism protein UlaG (beta-lactamase superfamily)